MRIVLTRSFTADGERYVAGDVVFAHPTCSGLLRLERTEVYLEPWMWGLFLPDSEVSAFVGAQLNRIKKGS